MGFKIGVISDTHGLLRDEVRERLQGCDRIFHAGDIDTSFIVEELNSIAPAFFVRGNVDRKWAEDIPETLVVDDIGIRIFMVHNVKRIDRCPENCDLVIYGHSHKYEEKHSGGKVWLNPGSCGPKRFRLPVTMAMLWVEDDGRFRIERVDIETRSLGESSKGSGADSKDSEISAAMIKEYLPAIMKEIDRGASVEQLAKRFGLSKELAEQICRMYLTHPGVDADGIMRRLGV